MLFCKSMTASLFQIFFECFGFGPVIKSDVCDQLPRFEFIRMDGFSIIMFRKPFLQIIRNAGVFLVGVLNAAEEIDIVHDGEWPCFAKATQGILRFFIFACQA